MIHPTVNDITKGKYNRYTLVIAAAKSARHITNLAGAEAERAAEAAENDRMGKDIRPDTTDPIGERAVTMAVEKLLDGEYKVVLGDNAAKTESEK